MKQFKDYNYIHLRTIQIRAIHGIYIIQILKIHKPIHIKSFLIFLEPAKFTLINHKASYVGAKLDYYEIGEHEITRTSHTK